MRRQANVSSVVLALVAALVAIQLGVLACTPLERVSEHLPWGIPEILSVQTLSIKTAYVACYNTVCKCPDWVAYHVKADYLNTPERDGKYSEFHDHLNAARDDYKYSSYDRGHLAPFKIAGGDRNDDKCYAGQECNDEYDEQGVLEINYMTNIAPQYCSFNRKGGLWYELEERVRDWIEDDALEVWIIAGCVYWDGAVEMIGQNRDIQVPDAFFKIVTRDDGCGTPLMLAFLFPHQKVRTGAINDFLVSVDLIEALTGFNFFPALAEGDELILEATNTAQNWPDF